MRITVYTDKFVFFRNHFHRFVTSCLLRFLHRYPSPELLVFSLPHGSGLLVSEGYGPFAGGETDIWTSTRRGNLGPSGRNGKFFPWTFTLSVSRYWELHVTPSDTGLNEGVHVACKCRLSKGEDGKVWAAKVVPESEERDCYKTIQPDSEMFLRSSKNRRLVWRNQNKSSSSRS